MSAKPTPGPWIVAPSGYRVINDDLDVCVANCGSDSFSPDDTTACTNAALIVAACNACQQIAGEDGDPIKVAQALPELIEELKRSRAMFDSLSRIVPDSYQADSLRLQVHNIDEELAKIDGSVSHA